MEERTLTPDQIRFVAEYVIDRNATRAYLRVYPGVTYGTAAVQAHRLLKNPNVAAEIDAAAREHARRCGISARRVLRELAMVAHADMGDLFEADDFTGLPKPRKWSEVDPAARRPVASVKIKRRVVRNRNRGKQADEDRVEEVEEVEYRLANKLDALKQLATHLGLTNDGEQLEKLLALLGRDDQGNQPGNPPVSPPGGPPPPALPPGG